MQFDDAPGVWQTVEDTKFFQDLAGRYFLEDYQGQLGFCDMGQLLRMAKRAGLERDKLGLDLGCGNGRPGLFIVRRNRCRLVGLDSVPEALQIGQHRAERYGLENRAAFICADVNQTLPFAPETFDSIISAEGFQFGVNFEQVYLEAHRVLKPDGGFAFYLQVLDEAAIEQEPVELQEDWRRGRVDHAGLLQAAGFTEMQAFEVTGELLGLVRRMKSAYEEPGVLEKLRESIGANLANQFYDEVLRLHRHLSNEQLHRWLFVAKK